MKMTPEIIKVCEEFFDYCNPVSIQNRIEAKRGDDGQIYHDMIWTASIGDIVCESKSPWMAMKRVLTEIEKEKANENN